MEALLTERSALPPAVVSVWATPGRARMSCAILSATLVVVGSELPSGVRTRTLNCDWSSAGRKFLPTYLKSGPIEKTTRTLIATMVLRCAIDHVSMRVYQTSRNLKKNDSLELCSPAFACLGGL